MRLEASLHMRQEMRMRLAPQIIQSIEILQLPLIELKQRIEEELLENALLEQVDPTEEKREEPSQTEASASGETESAEAAEDKVEPVTVDEANEAEQYQRLDELTRYYDDYGAGRRSASRHAGEDDPKQEAFDNSPAPDIALPEHLTRQLTYMDIAPEIKHICENIIANLDDHGWLSGPLEEITASMGGEVTPEDGEEALHLVQSLEPRGVGARDIKECLLLQLDPRRGDYDLLRTLIEKHFDDILRNKYPKVAREVGCTMEELKEAVEEIGKLNPTPGALFEKSTVPHVMPDLRIEESDGEYIVLLNDSWLPPLRISAYYARRLQQKDLDPKTREYLQKKLQNAQGLIAAIEQRRTTVHRVAAEIVKVQRDFFDKGPLHLTPLKMQDIADAVGVHVSTVSRAISDKYAETPRGIYSLKYFFTGGLAKEGGDTESWEVVRQKLLSIVDREDKGNPLSDEDLAKALKEEGIEIARRTVSKYRKSLSIPSSRQRKRY